MHNADPRHMLPWTLVKQSIVDVSLARFTVGSSRKHTAYCMYTCCGLCGPVAGGVYLPGGEGVGAVGSCKSCPGCASHLVNLQQVTPSCNEGRDRATQPADLHDHVYVGLCAAGSEA
jgi:hypothetical protein